MFALEADGEYASGKHGIFRYSSYQMAYIAAKILGKRDNRYYKVVPYER